MKNLMKHGLVTVLVIMNCASFKTIAQFCRNDLSFNPGTGVAGSQTTRVLASAIQGDGKIIIGGNFTSYNGTARNNIARLNADGTLDASFNPGTGPDDGVYTISIQSDGKIIIGGDFFSYNGTTRYKLTRLNADGTLDATFNPGGDGAYSTVFTTAIQSDGKIIIGGAFLFYNGTPINRIARLNGNGTLDAGFNPGTGADNMVRTSALQSDGKIIIGGNFFSYNGAVKYTLARLNTDGSLDGTFTTGANGQHLKIALQNDGKIIIAGVFNSPNGATYFLTRLNADGSLDGTFNTGTGPDYNVETIAIQNDGKIIIGGRFLFYNGALVNHITRLNADGSLDGTFNPGGAGANYHVYTTAIQNNGKIIIAGAFTSFTGTARNRIARVNSDNIPVPTIRSTMICPGGSVTLTASSGAAYLWNTGATTQSITVSTPGNYSVVVDDCAAWPVTVSYKPVPVITPSGYTNLCPGQTVVLSATAGSSYQWSTGETTKDITVSIAGNYSVAVTDADGCTQSSIATTVTVQSLVAPGTSQTGTVILNPCFGGLFLQVTGYPNGQGYTFAWYKTGVVNPVSNAYNIFITTPGDYYVVVSRNGCSSSPPSATVHVTNEQVFGNNTWNVYLWQNVNYDEHNPYYEFQGYYTEPLLSFDTRDRWNEYDAPSFSANNYIGCQYDVDYFLFSAKRKGFPCGRYKINIPGHDDWAELWVDGVKVWEHIGAGDSHANIWEGDLGPNSTMEYKVAEIYGAAYGAIQFGLLNSTTQMYYLDADGDGYGDAANSIVDCIIHAGYVLNNTDCNDGNATINPATVWVLDNDGDGWYTGSPVAQCTSPGSGYVIKGTHQAGDCNDNNAALNPGKAEVCGNNIDDNCDGQIEEGCNSKPLLRITDASVSEANGTVTLTVTLSKKSTKTVSVSYSTADGTARSKASRNNPADYTAKSGTLTIPANAQSVTFRVTILDDSLRESTEQFTVQLSKPLNASIEKGTGTVTILDDDAVTTRVAESKTNITAAREDLGARLAVQAMPNPSSGHFTLLLQGRGNEPVQLTITDALGRMVERRIGVAGNSRLAVGGQYRAGIYFVELRQGKEREVLKLVKL